VLAASENSGDPGLPGSPDQKLTIEYFGLSQAIACSRRPSSGTRVIRNMD
jgi:hypothetical protein